MKVAQVLPQTSLIERKVAGKARTALDIAKELNLKPIPMSDNIAEALKIKSNNGYYFDGKTPTGSIENPSNVIDFIV